MHVPQKSTKRFCSRKCQGAWQSKQIGDLNPRTNRVMCLCSFCGKELSIIPSNGKRFKSHFCNAECRKKWYSTTYSQSQEWKEISRLRAVKILSTSKPIKNTKPQLIVNAILDKSKIKYINEYPYDYYCVDNYLQDYNLIIEVMGDFWHCNPIKYLEVKQPIQQKRVFKDRIKKNYILDLSGINILYVWEYDLKNNPMICEKLILEYISCDGILENYNSFNYHIKDKKLVLNENIINSFQESTINA